MDLPTVLDRLHQYGQRATYAALGGIIGQPARSVMHGQPKTPRNSWIVAKQNGQPTGYGASERDPRLATSPKPITSPDELTLWLQAHP
jgi:hypothetical protein